MTSIIFDVSNHVKPLILNMMDASHLQYIYISRTKGCAPKTSFWSRGTKDSVTHESKSFLVHLLPTRNVESNHVRSVIDLHCEPQNGIAHEFLKSWEIPTSPWVSIRSHGLMTWMILGTPMT